MFVNLYNQFKSMLSRVNDLIKSGEPKSPIPLFQDPKYAADYLMDHCKYTGDPLYGVMDFNINPERLQYAMVNPKQFDKLSVDCDDYAVWSFVALSKIHGCKPKIITLIDSMLVGSHVICVYEYKTTYGNIYGAIDTNGHRILKNLSSDTILNTWNEIYRSMNFHYIYMEETPSPF